MPAPDPRPAVTVNEIGEYVSHHSCERRFKLSFNNRAEARNLLFAERLFNALDPVLQEEASKRENEWERSLQQAGLRNILPFENRTADERPTWTDFLTQAALLPHGEMAYAREICIEDGLGVFQARGRIDFVVVRWVEGRPRIRIVECKASRRDKTYQRIQVAVYGILARRSFLLENVYGLAYEGKDEGLKLLIEGIRRVNRATGDNYSVAWRMLNAADYGVPQIRERVFIVGSRDGRKFEFPPPTHTSRIVPDDLFLRTLAPHVPAWDAIGDLPQPRDEQALTVRVKWGALLPSIPEGQNYLWHTNRRGGMPLFGWRTRYWSFLLKLSKRRPSWTIQAQPGAAVGPFHWENRRLTTKEMCRLQTFPEDVRFDCGRTEVQRMLGNAVPALLAEVIAGKMAQQFFGKKAIKRPILLPTPKRPIPPEEEPAKIPKQYLKYVGNHADHPGEGRRR